MWGYRMEYFLHQPVRKKCANAHLVGVHAPVIEGDNQWGYGIDPIRNGSQTDADGCRLRALASQMEAAIYDVRTAKLMAPGPDGKHLRLHKFAGKHLPDSTDQIRLASTRRQQAELNVGQSR